jgi:Flp pilus assembly protein TadG
MKRTHRPSTRLGLCAAEDGTALVEFALISAVLVIPLVIGLYDFGTALFQWMEVGNAARAGAEYATYNGSFNETSIVAAVTNATALSSTIQPNTSQGASPLPAPTQFCGCPTASGVTATTTPTSSNTPPACGSTGCSNGGFDGTYVTVLAQAQYTPIFPYPGIVPPVGYFTLSAQTTVRIN